MRVALQLGGVRSAISNGSTLPRFTEDAYLGRKLGFLREYIAAIGAEKDFIPKSNLSDLNYILANPTFRRFLSNEAPKKKSKFGLAFASGGGSTFFQKPVEIL